MKSTKQLTELPKYFVIKYSDNPLWFVYMKWVNDNFNGSKILFGLDEDGYIGAHDKQIIYTNSPWDYSPVPEVLTLAEWDRLVNGSKEVAESKEQLQGKIKLRVDILKQGKMLKTVIDIVASINSGKVKLDLDYIESYLNHENKMYPHSNNGTSLKRGEENELLISDDNGATHYLVIREIVLHELTGCPTMDRQGILDEQQHELLN